MSGTPKRKAQEDGDKCSSSAGASGNESHISVLKYPHDEMGTHSAVGGKVVVSPRHEYHALCDMVKEDRIPKIAPRSNESCDAERRSPLLPNMLFRVQTPCNPHSDHVGLDSRMEFRDSKDCIKEIKVENHNMKSGKYDGRADDFKESKHERDTYSIAKGNEKLDKDGCCGSNSQLNFKDVKELHLKQYPDATGGNNESWQTSRCSLHGPADARKEGSHVDDKDYAKAREAVGDNKVDAKGDDKFKDKDGKRKEGKHSDRGEIDKERIDQRNNLQHGNNNNKNKELCREIRESERWGSEKKEPQKEKDKFYEKDNVKELWSCSVKETPHVEKIPGKLSEQESSTLEPKNKVHNKGKNVDKEARDKKDRDGEFEPERPNKRIRNLEKELEHVEGGTEREREVFSCGVQQRKRMKSGDSQLGNCDSRIRSGADDNEGSQGKAGVLCVVYKIGECMQELVKLWKEYESSEADKACDGTQNGPTLEICVPAEHVTTTNRQVKGGQLWGTDVYTVDSDLVAVLIHTGYWRPMASPPPSAIQELRATIRVMPPQDCYNSTLRNNVRSRAWGAAIGCSYRIEQCCIVKKGGGIIDLAPCLTHSSTMEPTLAPVVVERTMTTRAAASNALRKQRFLREVTVQFNLCMEPWMKYSISAVADKGFKNSLFTSARLKKGEVLYVETLFCRYELCFDGEKLVKGATASTANGVRSGVNGESTVMDVFRWSRCKHPLPERSMQSIGIPLPPEHVEVLVENLEWDDISWSQTGAWIGGRDYHLARAHFLSQN